MIKILYSIQWIQGKLCFQGNCKLLKNPEWQRYIQYSGKFHGKLCFPGQGEKNFNTVYSASKCNYPEVSCLGEHNTQETLPP